MPLILLGAPLGNPEDASARFRTVLASADIVAAEDTRRLARLASSLGVTMAGRVVSYFEGNERRKTDDLVELLRDGATVVVVTDGGMPSVSDPGFRLVRAAAEAGIPVTAAPGPSAVTTALALSGLPCDRFCFEGFPPRKRGERRTAFAALAHEPRTLIFFEAPHRLAETLEDLAEAFGADRRAAVCRELTKTYEEVLRETLGALAGWAAVEPPRGEITIVVHGASRVDPSTLSDADLVAAVEQRVLTGVRRTSAIAEVAKATGAARQAVYDAVVRGKRDAGTPGVAAGG